MIDYEKVIEMQGKALQIVEGVINSPPTSLTEEEFNANTLAVNVALNVLNMPTTPFGMGGHPMFAPDPSPEGDPEGATA